MNVRKKREIHGGRGTKLYGVYCSMRQRCGNPNSKYFRFYGARGIRVCDEWLGSFRAFRGWALQNGYVEGLGLEMDRIDTTGNYEPGNCRFVTSKVNNRNRRDSRRLTTFGETKTVAEWAEDPRARVSARTINLRVVRYGWEHAKAISKPSQMAKSIPEA